MKFRENAKSLVICSLTTDLRRCHRLDRPVVHMTFDDTIQAGCLKQQQTLGDSPHYSLSVLRPRSSDARDSISILDLLTEVPIRKAVPR